MSQDVTEAAKLSIAEMTDEDLDLLTLAHLHLHRDDTAQTTHTALHTKVHARKGAVHISCDYAQNLLFHTVHSKQDQCTLKPRGKIIAFGLCCESLLQHVNYLVDERGCAGKGADETISCLHYCLENHAQASTCISLHCDNCTGQNNNAVVQYVLWRDGSGRNRICQLPFMIVDQTRFGPDWCFGLLLPRKSEISSIAEVGSVVNHSTNKEINKVQYIRDPEISQLLVKVYYWFVFLGKDFRSNPGLTKYHHFHMELQFPDKGACERVARL